MSSKGNIKKFEDYEIEEFLSDEFFVQWVKNPNDNTTHFWEKWLAANPRKRPMVAEAAEVIRAIHYRPEPALSDESYVKLFENIIKADEGLSSLQPNNASKGEKWYSFFSVRRAAVFFLVCLGAWVIYSSLPDTTPKESTPLQWITKTNPKGQKTTVRLKDGTVIHLNANSSISYPETFSESVREIKLLNGVAFFDVKKETRPFIVSVSKTQVEVLGTSFNISHKNEKHLEVALVEGSVKVKDILGNQLMLAPSEKLQMGEDGYLSKSTFDVIEVTGWKDKYLVFKNDDFEAVAQKLENWYGVDIQTVGDFPKGWSYSGIYLDESLANTLEGIRQTSEISYTIADKKVVISKLK
ncbi:FecR domain-containing protein [Algoriphagus jejuensis]|uniref:FecR domain-containing protein n=1 Tax=Algoriphagus jejuensis TaxID=419934 RepID=A0ABN1N0L2_9BACT